MARVYVKGYTKSDGTKVEGHYREMNAQLSKEGRSNNPTAVIAYTRLWKKVRKNKTAFASQSTARRVRMNRRATAMLKRW